MYEVPTEDGYQLTLFNITGRVGRDKLPSKKPPLLIQHGVGQDAAYWLSTQDPTNDPFVLKLLDRGYDIWMGNNRGTRYSNVNPRFPDADNPDSLHYKRHNFEKYDYSWQEMGLYDQPANIEKIIEVTKAPKVTYVGYSQGTVQMISGLAQLE